MSSQRVTAPVAAEDRSAHPAIRGVPWWAAIFIAVAATLAGLAIDAAANRELTSVFAVFYAVGCIGAVLAVRHTGIFTAVVQPPLILFVAIPSAYYLMHSADIAGVKDLVINCFYPLIERFGLMFITALAVLLIGVARWYFESTKHRRTAAAGVSAAARGDLLAGLRSRVRGLFGTHEHQPGASDRPPRKRTTNRAARPPRRQPSAGRATGARDTRPLMDHPDTPSEPPRRRRPAQPDDFDRSAEMPPRRRRGPRDPADRDSEYRREAWTPEPWPPRTRASEHPDRSRRRHDPSSYDPDSPRTPRGGTASSHLPSSNARYRGGDGASDDAGYRRPRY